MDLIVLDLEWNQSSNFKNGRNELVPFEIIEIGAVKLNTNFEKTDEFCQVIRPAIYKELNEISREITHFRTKDLYNGKPFKEVFSDFCKWCGDDYVFCTWGCTDITELQRNMKYHNFPLFKPPVFYYDIQKIFSLLYESDKKVRRSLEYATDFLKIEKTIPFHRALSDAHYTSEIIKHMTIDDLTDNYSVDYYQKPKNKQEEMTFVFKDYSKYISREFLSKNDAMADKRVISTTCYKCGKSCRKKIRWFSCNSKIYYSLAFCPTHGYLKGKLRIKKSDNDSFFVVKTIKLTDEEGADKIRARQLDIRKKRQLRRKRTTTD